MFYSFDRFTNDFSSNRVDFEFKTATFHLGSIRISEEIEIYERSVTSLLDLTGQIGGIYELFEIIAAFFVGYYNGILFDFTLVNCINENRLKGNNHKQAQDDNPNQNRIYDDQHIPEARILRNK